MGIILWPFKMIWALVGFVFGILGTIISLVVGVVLFAVGLLLSGLLITAFLGIPLVILGGLLLVRAVLR